MTHRPFIGVVLWLLPALVLAQTPADDPIAADLRSAKSEYVEAIEVLKQDLLRAIDQAIERVDNDDRLSPEELLARRDALIAQREAFVADASKLPTGRRLKSAVRSFERAKRTPAAELTRAFDIAIAAYRGQKAMEAMRGPVEERREFLEHGTLTLEADAATARQADPTWSAVFVDGVLDTAGGTNHRASPFLVKNRLLVCPPQTRDRLLFTKKQFTDFRARIDYRVGEGAEAALIPRCPNARRQREEGLSVGMTSNAWVYNVNKAFHYVYKSGASKKIRKNPNPIAVAAGQWHVLEVEMVGASGKVFFDGRFVYDFQSDEHLVGCLGIHTRAPGLEVRRFDYRELRAAGEPSPPADGS